MKHNDKLNGKQKRAINEWNRSIPFDFMLVDEINSGRMSFRVAWHRNVDWLNDWVFETTDGIDLEGCGMLKDL
ncbi:hypothetical protein LCGC14_1513980 [marine sediment metagenome]|uniref:Uncharacterized protein n=1 Tax=marine sediment metagenome TaxID=412755 RepID=A0A0F9LG73_9ZZZZ